MKTLFTIAFATSIVFSGPVTAASSPIEATQNCLADSTSGKDRKLMAKWMFLAMAAHPEFKSPSTPSPEIQEATSREFADMVMRLMTIDCKTQMQAMIAVDADVASAMKVAFSHLGQVAMQELMTNKDVNASVGQFATFIDKDKLSSALGKAAGN